LEQEARTLVPAQEPPWSDLEQVVPMAARQEELKAALLQFLSGIVRRKLFQ
jgi:hypothetical protein